MLEMKSSTQDVKTVHTIPRLLECRQKQHMLHASKSIVEFQELYGMLGALVNSDHTQCVDQNSETNCFGLGLWHDSVYEHVFVQT